MPAIGMPLASPAALARSRALPRRPRLLGARVVRGNPLARAGAASDDGNERESAVLMLNNAEELEALLARCKEEKRKCVINVSSSKCGPCKLLLPTLEAYGEKYPACAFARFYFDKDESLQTVMKGWKVQGVPTYRLYEPSGELKNQFATGQPQKLGSALYLFLDE